MRQEEINTGLVEASRRFLIGGGFNYSIMEDTTGFFFCPVYGKLILHKI